MYRVKKGLTLEWLVAFLLFALSNPYFFWGIPVNILACLALPPILFINKSHLLKSNTLGATILTICYALIFIRHLESFLGALFILMIPLFLLLNKELIIKSYTNFIKILSVVSSLSLITYLLVVFLHITIPYKEIQAINELKEFTYLQYPFLIIENIERGLNITRFYGVYDEPGVIGSLAAVILCKERFDFKNKKHLIPIFIAGILTFSLYFYIISLVFILFFSKTKWLIIFSFFICISTPLLYRSSDLRTLVFNRFIVEDGRWQGNSRYSSSFQQWYNEYRHTPNYLLGKGMGYNLIVNKGGASYRDIITNYGIILFSLYMIGWCSLSYYQTNKKEWLLSCFLIFSFIYQRPFIFDLSIIYTFLFICFYHKEEIAINQTYDEKSRHKQLL